MIIFVFFRKTKNAENRINKGFQHSFGLGCFNKQLAARRGIEPLFSP